MERGRLHRHRGVSKVVLVLARELVPGSAFSLDNPPYTFQLTAEPVSSPHKHVSVVCTEVPEGQAWIVSVSFQSCLN